MCRIKKSIALIGFLQLHQFPLVRLLNHNPISSIQYLGKLRNEKICLFCYNICPRVPRVLTKSSFERWPVFEEFGLHHIIIFANIPTSKILIYIFSEIITLTTGQTILRLSIYRMEIIFAIKGAFIFSVIFGKNAWDLTKAHIVPSQTSLRYFQESSLHIFLQACKIQHSS